MGRPPRPRAAAVAGAVGDEDEPTIADAGGPDEDLASLVGGPDAEASGLDDSPTRAEGQPVSESDPATGGAMPPPSGPVTTTIRVRLGPDRHEPGSLEHRVQPLA